MQNIVRTRVIFTDIHDWKKIIEVRAKFFKQTMPVDTIAQVTLSVNPDWLVEFEADAIVSNATNREIFVTESP